MKTALWAIAMALWMQLGWIVWLDVHAGAPVPVKTHYHGKSLHDRDV